MVGAGRKRSPKYLRRVRNRPALRRRSRLRVLLRFVLVVGGLAVGGLAAWLAFHHSVNSPTLALRQIVVDGAPPGLERQVRGRLSPALGTSLLMLDLEELQRVVVRLPRVRHATVRRRLPSSIEVSVEPRVARATVEASDGALQLVDAEGVLLGPSEEPAPELPLLRLRAGTSASTEAAEAGERSPSLAMALRVLDWLERSGPGVVPPVDHLALDDRGVALVFADGLEAVIGDDGSLADKMEGLQALLADDPPETPAVVDLRFTDMVIVRDPTASTGSPSPLPPR